MKNIKKVIFINSLIVLSFLNLLFANENKKIFEITESYLIENDTIKITQNNLNPEVLIEGTHRYLVYFKKGKEAPRSMVSLWTRTIERNNYKGRKAITINQLWESKDTIVHTATSISDAKTMQWLYHKSWWKGKGTVEYDLTERKGVINDEVLSDFDTIKNKQKPWKAFKKSWDTYALNWHLDLEVFPILPYKNEVTFAIPYYDPGFSAPKKVYYTVTGSKKLKAYNNQEIDCWILEHGTKGNKEVFWISKQTKEVLKLEQEINDGQFYRYKIKLGFSV